ncbi:hypothetical protein A0H81_10582 [Grifola frondosa]|uniref:Uncharacterized protein n=1 Tax=Grifola frondosa TaxID=5627 RepID=A0A1C7LYY5_GRIFR|nr:hypothetical protein A0H81_10582 [Grifola frondosa]
MTLLVRDAEENARDGSQRSLTKNFMESSMSEINIRIMPAHMQAISIRFFYWVRLGSLARKNARLLALPQVNLTRESFER